MLAVDTSTSRGVLALGLLGGSEDVIWAGSYVGGTGHAEMLLTQVDGALSAAGVARGEIAAVAVGVGPGSFSGVRVAVSFAKGLALTRELRLVAASSLRVMAAAVSGPETRVALLDARRGEVYAAAYDAVGREVAPARHLRVGAETDAWLLSLGAPLCLVGDAVPLVTAPPGARILRSPATDGPDGSALLNLGRAMLEAGEIADVGTLEPLYVRPPDLALPRSVSP